MITLYYKYNILLEKDLIPETIMRLSDNEIRDETDDQKSINVVSRTELHYKIIKISVALEEMRVKGHNVHK